MTDQQLTRTANVGSIEEKKFTEKTDVAKNGEDRTR